MDTKKKLTLIVLTAVLTGCQSITVPTENGKVVIRSFGQKTVLKELKAGDWTVKGYNNNQVDGMVEMYNLGIQTGKKLAQ